MNKKHEGSQDQMILQLDINYQIIQMMQKDLVELYIMMKL